MERNVFTNEQPIPEPMTFEQAKNLLGMCKRFELRDHAFGDREVYWKREDVEVGEGYFGGGSSEVYINEEFGGVTFRGEEARALSKCGIDVTIGRNDETGPDIYRGG
jgi:hypothetical protein